MEISFVADWPDPLSNRWRGAAAMPRLASLLSIVARINIILGAFNLIPIPPLDGSKILMGLLPLGARESTARLEPYGFFILVAFLFTGLLNPVVEVLQNAINGLISSIVGLIIFHDALR